MAPIKTITREWRQAVLPDQVRLRCMYQRQAKEVLWFLF